MRILPFVEPRTEAGRALIERPEDRLLYINGEWRLPLGGEWIETLDPATGGSLARIASGSAADIDAAVIAARQSLSGPWASMVPAERSAILSRIADLLEAEIDALAEIESLDQGKPMGLARWAELPGAVAQFRYFAGLVHTIEGAVVAPSVTYQPAGRAVHAWTLRQPVGVVGAIVPWNSPLVLTAMKVAPALAAGCSIVLKPAELTSLSALRLADVIERAGVPRGVFNVVTGFGATAGAALASHGGVDKITFTGSTETGRAIVHSSAENLARVTLELGGKSPAIILPDADLDLAIPGIANGIFGNSGQVCVANSRVYAHEDIFDSFIEGLAGQAGGIALGHQLNPETMMGPLVSTLQAERVASFVDEARRDGASILCGGERGGDTGAFYAPTIVADVAANHRISREEVFGPVLVVHRYRDLDAVVAEANDSPYGLAGSVWTRSFSDAHRLSRRIDAGTVWINTHSMFDSALTIGGLKQSGYGRDSGRQALDNYLEWKTVCALV
jgi:phenylacetaldehyde dehydrogenase